ncbi:hypothetical protein OPIT5_24335 [Opitutaceae bacterium TAV5]|nr:hypothetical protein OPIT5_24335 [Opitutaceae bacterium TAV5]
MKPEKIHLYYSSRHISSQGRTDQHAPSNLLYA